MRGRAARLPFLSAAKHSQTTIRKGKLMDYKEKAATVAHVVNSFTFSYKDFCEAMSREHKTLQQNFTRLCMAWIRHCASEDYAKNTDGRNEASHTVCKAVTDTCSDADLRLTLPFV